MSVIDCIVINDEELQLQVLTMMLERIGMSVKPYSSASKFIQDLESDEVHFRLVITDFYMPEFSGADIIERLYSERDSNTPIIVTSSALNMPKELEFEKAQPQLHTVIPLQPQALIKKVIDILENPETEYFACLYVLEKLKKLTSIESLEELVAVFIREVAEKQKLLEAARSQRSLTQLTSNVHGLKGSSSMLGLNNLYRHCSQLEQLAKNSSEFSEEIKQKLKELNQQINVSVNQLNKVKLQLQTP